MSWLWLMWKHWPVVRVLKCKIVRELLKPEIATMKKQMNGDVYIISVEDYQVPVGSMYVCHHVSVSSCPSGTCAR